MPSNHDKRAHRLPKAQLPKVLILDYKTWRCGGTGDNKLGKGDSQLLNSQKYSCCLGQFSLQAKPAIKREHLLGIISPECLNTIVVGLSFPRNFDDVVYTLLSEKAMSINDAEHTSVEEKVVALRKLFGKKGFTIRLKNFPKRQLEAIRNLQKVQK